MNTYPARRSPPFLLLLLLLLTSSTLLTASTTFKVSQDRRALIPIFEFGFYTDGHFQINVTDVHIDANVTKYLGLFLLRTASFQDALIAPSNEFVKSECPKDWDLRELADSTRNQTTVDFVDFRTNSTTFQYVHRITDRPGLWTAYVLNCNVWDTDMDGTGAPSGPSISASVSSLTVNPPDSLLSAGQQNVTWVYLVSTLFYLLVSIKFGSMLRQVEAQVFWIHRLMFALLICVTMDKSFHWVQNSYLQNGIDARAWDFAAYLLTSIKSSLAMTIVALIASGWSFISPILPARQRKIVLCIIPFQIIANLAQFMIDMLAIGSPTWETWSNLFPLFDLASFLVILWTILTARAHLLNEDAENEGKSEVTLEKINLWSRLYGLVLGYLYLTRIIAVLFAIILPYTHLWLVTLFTEIVSAWFYSVVGYKFRPAAANPYTQLDFDENDDSIIKDEDDNRAGTSLEMEQL